MPIHSRGARLAALRLVAPPGGAARGSASAGAHDELRGPKVHARHICVKSEDGDSQAWRDQAVGRAPRRGRHGETAPPGHCTGCQKAQGDASEVAFSEAARSKTQSGGEVIVSSPPAEHEAEQLTGVETPERPHAAVDRQQARALALGSTPPPAPAGAPVARAGTGRARAASGPCSSASARSTRAW